MKRNLVLYKRIPEAGLTRLNLNVVLFPHIGLATKETRLAMINCANYSNFE